MSENKSDGTPIKDLVFRGAFLVALVYILVFIYNARFASSVKQTPIPNLPENTLPEKYIQEETIIPESSEAQEDAYGEQEITTQTGQ